MKELATMFETHCAGKGLIPDHGAERTLYLDILPKNA